MNIYKLIASLVISFAAAIIGTTATTANIPTWYAALQKPFFSPPDWLFGPVWSILYTLIAISLYLIWTKSAQKDKKNAYIIFGVQLVLNATWSLVFFDLHQTWLGLVIILAMDIAVALTIRSFWKISRYGAWLLVPYLVWIIFATCLNAAIAFLN